MEILFIIGTIIVIGLIIFKQETLEITGKIKKKKILPESAPKNH